LWVVGAGLLLLVGTGAWFWWQMSAQPPWQSKKTLQVSTPTKPTVTPSPQASAGLKQEAQLSSESKRVDQSSPAAEHSPNSPKGQDQALERSSQASKIAVEPQVIQPPSSASAVNRRSRRSKAGFPLASPRSEVVAQARQDSLPPPRERASDPRSEAELFQLALLQQQTGDYQSSLENYRKLLDINPRNAIALNNMGVILQQTGQLAEAADLLRKALDIDARYDKAHTNLGVVLQLQKHTQAAIDSHMRALALNDQSWESAVNLGLLFWSEGDLKSARQFFSKALAVRDDASLWHYLGLVSEQQGQKLEAIRHYRQALKKEDPSISHLREEIQSRIRYLLGGNRDQKTELVPNKDHK
jgi:Tfp pilus assembly protein PilF